jgi:exopolysaccharide biosynthesis polyprenyl glycosylphosphotransferase
MGRLLEDFLSVDVVSLWLLDVILFVALIYVAFLCTGDNLTWRDYDSSAFRLLEISIFAIFFSTFAGVYRPQLEAKLPKVIFACVSIVLLGYAVFLTVGDKLNFVDIHLLLNHKRILLIFLLLWSVCLTVNRLAYNAALRSGILTRGVVVVGDISEWQKSSLDWNATLGFQYKVRPLSVEAIDSQDVIKQLRRDKIWAVITTTDGYLGTAERGGRFLMDCRSHGIHVYSGVEFLERHLKRVDTSQLPDNWLAYKRNFSITIFDRVARRLFDIIFSSSLLVLVSPILVFAAIFIKLESRGPVLYRQTRVGYRAKEYEIYKFRSMKKDAEANGHAQWAVQNDPRITRVGGFVRRTRIDELPQLFNVLRGDMSVIGPRPERPSFVKLLTDKVPHYHDRSYVKPGITGWAQVSFPYGASVDDARMKLAYDLYYIKRRCLLFDLLILATTVRVVLLLEGSR